MSTDLLPDINIGPSAVIAGWIEAGIAVIVVTARTYTQAKVVGRMNIEDYIMILALVSLHASPEFSALSNSSTVDRCHAQHITHNTRRFLGHRKAHLLPDTGGDRQCH